MCWFIQALSKKLVEEQTTELNVDIEIHPDVNSSTLDIVTKTKARLPSDNLHIRLRY